jgi:hypothetical protein
VVPGTSEAPGTTVIGAPEADTTSVAAVGVAAAGDSPCRPPPQARTPAPASSARTTRMDARFTSRIVARATAAACGRRDRVGAASHRPLPHHRTCGSASGGSPVLPEATNSITDRHQAEIGPVAVRQGALERGGPREPPKQLASPLPPEDLHLQAAAHAGRTIKTPRTRRGVQRRGRWRTRPDSNRRSPA